MWDVVTAFSIFLLKIVTVVLAIVFLAWILSKISKKGSNDTISLEYLNSTYRKTKHQFLEAFAESGDGLAKEALKKCQEVEKKIEKTRKQNKTETKRYFVLEFKGDLQASKVKQLREEITAVLNVANIDDEIILQLESPGGAVADYGLAATQLARIREKGIQLTVCVDKVAASGGYLMACLANKLIAAPFAYIGSIGVVMQLPNFHNLLKKCAVDIVEITAGQHKRPLSMLGENTLEGKSHMQDKMQAIHEQFKDHVAKYRPSLALDKVATGDYWTATYAKDLDLIDEIEASDSYIQRAIRDGDVYAVKTAQKPSLKEMLLGKMQSVFYKLLYTRDMG
ncbi:MAG: protease SohB [Pseudomonadota bacterium]|nr:protease SohB [Pseudomonadota bacterium]